MDKTKLFHRMLSFLFPVRLPKPIPVDFIFEDVDYLEDGIGQVRVKPYRDAIDRHWKTQEEDGIVFHATGISISDEELDAAKESAL